MKAHESRKRGEGTDHTLSSATPDANTSKIQPTKILSIVLCDDMTFWSRRCTRSARVREPPDLQRNLFLKITRRTVWPTKLCNVLMNLGFMVCVSDFNFMYSRYDRGGAALDGPCRRRDVSWISACRVWSGSESETKILVKPTVSKLLG